LISCGENENFIRYDLSERMRSFLPRQELQPFRILGSDTFNLQVFRQETGFIETTIPGGQAAVLNADRLEREFITVEQGSDIPLLRFIYEAETFFDNQSPSLQRDSLRISVESPQGQRTTLLRFSFTDSLRCALPTCRFADTLLLDSVSYTNVYYNADETAGQIFINTQNGLLQYINADSTVYLRN